MPDQLFSDDVKGMANIIDDMAVTLIEQAGGIGSDSYELLEPCRIGGNPINKVFSQAMYTELEDKISAMKAQYNQPKHVEIVNFLEYSINTYLIGEEAILNPAYVQNTPYSVLSTELLILELNLLFYTQKALMENS